MIVPLFPEIVDDRALTLSFWFYSGSRESALFLQILSLGPFEGGQVARVDHISVTKVVQPGRLTFFPQHVAITSITDKIYLNNLPLFLTGSLLRLIRSI